MSRFSRTMGDGRYDGALCAWLTCLLTTSCLLIGCREHASPRKNFFTSYYAAALDNLREELGAANGSGADRDNRFLEDRSFVLEGPRLTLAALRRLTNAVAARHLTALDLRGHDWRSDEHTSIDADEAACLLAEQSEHLGGVFTLQLAQLALTDDGVACLAEIEDMQLRMLVLDDNCISGEGIAALARAPSVSELGYLSLSDNPLGDNGAEVLAQRPELSSLERLYLNRTGIGADGVRALVSSPHLRSLVGLTLEGNPFDVRLLDLLLDHPAYLPRLSSISVSGELDADLLARLEQRRPTLTVFQFEDYRSQHAPGYCSSEHPTHPMSESEERTQTREAE